MKRVCLSVSTLIALLMVMMCMSTAFAITINNHSFEADTAVAPYGIQDISGWVTNGQRGVNTSTINAFADNGLVPDGNNVAFLEFHGYICQTLDGFEKGKTYEISYRENARACGDPTVLQVTLGNMIIVPAHSVVPVSQAGLSDYYKVTARFTVPANGSYILSFNQGAEGDATFLLDDIHIDEVNPTTLTINNSSFEEDTPTGPYGIQNVSDWTTVGICGVNNSTVSVFADNGIIPNGNNAAFIQKPGSISQAIGGFEAGKTYELTYRENARSWGGADPLVQVMLDDMVLVDSHEVIPVSNAGYDRYYVRAARFTVPTSGSYTLSFQQLNNIDETATVAIDDVRIRVVDPNTLIIKNHSFDYDAIGAWPGLSTISGWDIGSNNTAVGYGLNNSSMGVFADNGVFPDGNAAFIQATTINGGAFIGQTVDGFDSSATYLLTYRENGRDYGNDPSLNVTLDGTPIVAEHTVYPTYGEYSSKAVLFTPPSSGSLYLAFNETRGDDSTVVLDDVAITRVGSGGDDLGIISGTVKHKSGLVIPGVTIKCVSTGETVSTDASGEYTLVVPSGSQTIEATYGDTLSANVTAVSAGSVTQDFTFTSNSLLVNNHSFEADAPNPPFGIGSISYWTKIGQCGLNSANTNIFALNTNIPDGSNIAFLQSDGGPAALSQPILVFEPGKYILTYRENARAECTNPSASVTLGDVTVVAPHSVAPNGGEYYTRSALFTMAAAGKNMLTFNANNTGANNVLLLDDISITKVGADGESLGIVTGKVTDATTGSPISGITVKCEAAGKSVITDQGGVYFLVLPSGSQTIKAIYQGIGYDATVDVVTADSVTKDFVLLNVPPESSLPDAKKLDDGTLVNVKGMVVTAKFSDCYYAEMSNRAAGIKIVSTSNLSLNDMIDVIGTIKTSNGEKYIEASQITTTGTGLVLPMGGNVRSIYAYQGIATSGLLMKTWGKVTGIAADRSYMYVDDGSNVNDGNATGFTGIKVDLAAFSLPTTVNTGDSVAVTGAVGRDASGVVIRPRIDTDVIDYAP